MEIHAFVVEIIHLWTGIPEATLLVCLAAADVLYCLNKKKKQKRSTALRLGSDAWFGFAYVGSAKEG